MLPARRALPTLEPPPVLAGWPPLTSGVEASAESREELLERLKGLEEIVSHQRKLLTDADWRYRVLVENLAALPALRAETPPVNGNGTKRSWWWPFRRQMTG